MNRIIHYSTSGKVALHLIVWFTVLWWLNSSLMGLELGPFKQENGTLLIPSAFGMMVNALLFYLSVYYFIPVFLLKRKQRSSFFIYCMLLIVGLTIIEFSADILYLSTINSEYKSIPPELSYTNVLAEVGAFFLFTLLINTGYLGLAFLYRLPSDWIKNEKQKSQLQQDKLSAELAFLRAQINPHFLFNGINSIYHLIGSDDDSAKRVLLMFSGLLRYQLYECKEDYILLSKEMEYVANYIRLEEIRKGEDACFKIDLIKDHDMRDNDLKIAPLLFTPFLENAFKYLSLYSEKEKNQLIISMRMAEGNLEFMVKNTVNLELVSGKHHQGGIGLENVKRRLNLLYPNKHKLELTSDNNGFSAHLKLELT